MAQFREIFQLHVTVCVNHEEVNYWKVTLMFCSHTAHKIFEPQHNKTNKVTVRPAKIQTSLGFSPVWLESSLSAQWVAKDPGCLHADSEDSDQTGRMPRLIWVFAGRTATSLVLSCRGSVVVLMLHFHLQLQPTHQWNLKSRITILFQHKHRHTHALRIIHLFYYKSSIGLILTDPLVY